jgi:hypothetical protein
VSKPWPIRTPIIAGSRNALGGGEVARGSVIFTLSGSPSTTSTRTAERLDELARSRCRCALRARLLERLAQQARRETPGASCAAKHSSRGGVSTIGARAQRA